MFSNIGNMLIIAGIVILIIGLAAKGWLGPLGHLPGDIIIRRENFTFYLPITTGILISVILSLIIWLLRRQ
ncbi:MAG: hypothetical protein BWY68_00584 [bacterium ADurb.Bin400]|nr:MAG: hypothetical protein BWY68_00584 [bacterium ADurb.Bin400]